jgi:ubiquinone/menaquinone biosynthesis C-methylase UbiE
MTLFKHFDFLAPHYDGLASSNPPQKLLALVDLPEGGVVLDAGGGTGRIAQHLRRKGAQVVVADESFKMLGEAHKKTGLQPVHALAESLPFGGDTFMRIIMVDAFHHLADQRQTVEELWRVLAPGGRIVIEEPDIRFFGVKLIALFEKLLLMRSHIISPQRIAALFGFPDVQVHIEQEEMNAWVIVEKAPA